MRNYVIINGVNSLTIKGLAINELPPIVKAPMRVLQEEIDGRDGDIITDLGYGAYDKIMTIGLYDGYDINEIIAFFNEEGTIVFSDEADKYYNFKIIEQIDYERLIKFRTASITFHCQPFKYPLTETPVEITNEYVEAEGTSITLTPTADAPMEIDLKGNTYQDSTTGKNLLPITLTSQTKNGIVIKVNDDNSITFNNTATSGTTINLNYTSGKYIHLVSGETYTISIKNNSGLYIRLAKVSDNTNVAQFDTPNTSLTFTSNYTGDCFVYIAVLNNTTFNNLTIYPMVEKSSSVSEYEPYTNGASPNPDYPQDIHVVSGDNTIVVEGKNLYNGTYNSSTEKLGVVATRQSDGGYALSGTCYSPTPGANADFVLGNCTLEAGTYTISGWQSNTGVRLRYRPTAGNWTGVQDVIEAGLTITLSEQKTLDLVISVSNGTNTNGTIVYPQIEKGNQSSTYTPYVSQSQLISLGVEMPSGYTRLDYIESSGTQYIDTGVSPTTQTGIKIQAEATTENNTDKILVGSRVGSNRFWIDFDGGSSKVVWGYGTYASTGTYSLNTKYDIDFNYNGSKKIKINGTSYDITGTYDNTGALSLYIFRANYTSAVAGNFKVYRCQIFEGTTKVRDLIPCKRDSDSAIGMLDLKHNVFYTNAGTGTFTYGNELPNGIELNKIGNYQDYFYKTDKWYSHKEIGKYVLTGEESNDQYWWSNEVNGLRFRPPVDNLIKSVANAPTYCNRFNQWYSGTTANNYIRLNRTTSSDYLGFWFGSLSISGVSSVATFKTYASSNDIILYYPLETPTDTEITDTTLLGQLEAIKNMTSYNGTTNISQENNDEPFIIKATAMKQGSGTATITNSGNIYSKPTIDIEGTGIVDVYIGANQIFSVNVDEEVIIDSTNLEAYKPDGTLANRNVTGNIANLKLPTGNSTISVDGDIDKATITNYTRWL